MRKPKKPASEIDLGWCLCISTDGEVYIGTRTPDFERWLPVYALPPLTEQDTKAIRAAICDLYTWEQGPQFDEKGAWYFRSDPKTQIDLSRQFSKAVEKEAAKRSG
jgi:hypothetical protein